MQQATNTVLAQECDACHERASTPPGRRSVITASALSRISMSYHAQ